MGFQQRGRVMATPPDDTRPADLPPPPQSPEEAALLQRFHRERAARKSAELLLTNKSRELYDALQRVRESEQRLQMALWARGEGVLERQADARAFAAEALVRAPTGPQELLDLLAKAFASTHDALVVVDAQWSVVAANRSFTRLTGLSETAVRASPMSDFISLPDVAQQASGWRGPGQLQGRDRVVPVEATVTFVAGQVAHNTCFIIALHDISERLQAESRLSHQALRDSLTELPNRAALEQHLDQRLRGGQTRKGEPFGLLFMDLDGFKAINDSFGHGEGDHVLREVAARLKQTLPQAFTGRWGGDEFVLVLPLGSGVAEVRQGAQALLAAMAVPIRLGYSNDMLISPSIGAVLYPADGHDAATLLRKADSAMYLAKEQGKNCLRLFEAQIEEGAMRRVRLQSLLRIDAERGAFSFAAQSKVDAERKVTGAELLARWRTRDFGVVSPAEFIPMAEQTGAIELLGRQALHSAAHLAAELTRIGRPLPVAVNLSPRQLLNSSFERIALQACQRHGVQPASIELELTESALTDASARALLERLRRQGFGLALDDFGTGHSSLSHLLNLPFQRVKIDRTFVKDALRNPKALVVIRGALSICQGLGLTTVAEGVETAEQFELLRHMGVNEFQGHLFAHPMPQDDWLRALAAAPLPEATD